MNSRTARRETSPTATASRWLYTDDEHLAKRRGPLRGHVPVRSYDFMRTIEDGTRLDGTLSVSYRLPDRLPDDHTADLIYNPTVGLRVYALKPPEKRVQRGDCKTIDSEWYLTGRRVAGFDRVEHCLRTVVVLVAVVDPGIEGTLSVPDDASKRRIGEAMADRVLAQTQSTGTYAPR